MRTRFFSDGKKAIFFAMDGTRLPSHNVNTMPKYGNVRKVKPSSLDP
jgi:hypothetical protein